MDDKGKFLLYTANDGAVKIEVFLHQVSFPKTQLFPFRKQLPPAAVKNIYALSADYDKEAPPTKEFIGKPSLDQFAGLGSEIDNDKEATRL